MLLEIELSVLVDEGPGKSAALTMDSSTALLVFTIAEAFLHYHDGRLGVHLGNEIVSNNILLYILMVEKVADLQEI
jgi:hypothetical protein